MKDTAFWVPEAKKDRLAEVTNGDALKNSSLRMCMNEEAARKNYFQGGAALCSTIDDYYRFAQMVANGGEFGGKRYLAKKTVEFMLSDHLVGMQSLAPAFVGPGYGFGLGFAVRRFDGVNWAPGSVGDANWAGIFGTSFTIDPKEKLVAIQLTQGASTRLRSRILFKNLIYGAMVD
jgi:CubicO group peptidase (beta-lactamase class C family)